MNEIRLSDDKFTCRLTGFAYAALACFGVEFITLFLGVSLFMRPIMLINIVLHFVGLILVILFYVDVSGMDPRIIG